MYRNQEAKMVHNILLIDDDSNLLVSMKAFFENEGCFLVKAVQNPDEGIALIRQKAITFSLALIDYHMPGTNGAKVIKQIREYDPKLTLVAFSGDRSNEVHNLTLESGAIFFVSKDTTDTKLLGIIYRICQEVERRTKPIKQFVETENVRNINSVGLIGVSNHQADIADLIRRFAPSSESVFIRGENGTGKELIARSIHQQSPRARGPFVAVNCASIPAELIESTLFGHEKGAFTGATISKIGKFEAASGGTLFLDEIGDMSYSLQSALLRVLQEKVFTPVGSTLIKKADARVIAATNAPIESKIVQGLFREDLFHRLHVLPINVLPLRERTEDIPVLAQAFVDQANHDNKTQKILTPAVVDELKYCSWPGNIRQLKHAITRMVILSEGKTLDTKILAQQMHDETEKTPAIDYEVLQFKAFQNEDRLIRSALDRGGQVISKAARLAHMSRSTFCDKMKRHGIDRTKLKSPEGA